MANRHGIKNLGIASVPFIRCFPSPLGNWDIPFLRDAELTPFELDLGVYPHEAMIFPAEDGCQEIRMMLQLWTSPKVWKASLSSVSLRSRARFPT
jgi:hypothetical protein